MRLIEDDYHCDVKLYVTFNKLLALKNFFSRILIMFQQQNLSIIRTFEERISAYMYFIVENALCQDLRNLNNLHQEIIVNTSWYILGFLATNFFSLVCMLLFKKYNEYNLRQVQFVITTICVERRLLQNAATLITKCRNCNFKIGKLLQNVTTLNKFVRYYKMHQNRHLSTFLI